MSQISLGFGTPTHGWLEVTLTRHELAIVDECPAKTRVVDASDVPCDSLEQLAAATCSMLEGRDEATVEWSLEPCYESWTFRRTVNGAVDLWVAVRGGKREQPTRFATVALPAFGRVVWRALRKLETDPVWQQGNASDVWSHPFPTKTVAALGLLAHLVGAPP